MKKILLLIILLLSPAWLYAEEQLYYTYIGTTFGGGIDKITYKDWFSDIDMRDTKNVSGSYFSGGFLMDIFVNDFVGEFSIEYINNSNSEISVYHLVYNATGKYSYQLSELFSITGGLGLYFETPPSNKSYNSGGGFNATLGSIFSLGREWKIIFDMIGRYGHFGIGEDSTRYAYGAKLGVVYKIGRI